MDSSADEIRRTPPMRGNKSCSTLRIEQSHLHAVGWSAAALEPEDAFPGVRAEAAGARWIVEEANLEIPAWFGMDHRYCVNRPRSSRLPWSNGCCNRLLKLSGRTWRCSP